MQGTVQNIIALEWEMFDKVQNRGGRAACQDDKQTFDIMRSSQLTAWSPEMQAGYLHDLQRAQQEGRNLLTEKYAYMMARTNPEEYAAIADRLPPRDPEKDKMIDAICQTHVAWLEDLAARYPHLAGRGRPIRRSEDAAGVTSFETYLWGELATYSADTLRAYTAYVASLKAQGQNLNEMVLKNTTQQYGYRSLEEAEAHLAAGGK